MSILSKIKKFLTPKEKEPVQANTQTYIETLRQIEDTPKPGAPKPKAKAKPKKKKSLN